MIYSIKHKGLKKFFLKNDPSGLNTKHLNRITQRLSLLDSMETLEDLKPFNLHSLQGELKNHYSIRVNGNYRMTFVWVEEEKGVYILDYQDYH